MATEKPNREEYVMVWKQAVGSQLALLRKQKELTQSDVASALSVNQRTVSDLERGRSTVFDHVLSYCDLLDVNPAVLMARANLTVRADGVDEPQPI